MDGLTFIERLKAAAPRFEWEIDSQGRLRGRPKLEPIRLCCPITAVVYAETGQHFYDFEFMSVARGAEIADPLRIAVAADGSFKSKLRSELLDAVGL